MRRFAIALVAGLLATACQQPARTPNAPTPPQASPAASEEKKAPPDALSETLDAIVARYRKTIVLLEDDDSLPEAQRDKASLVGKIIFQENHRALSNLSGSLTGEIGKAGDFSQPLAKPTGFSRS